jgi:hypothetical protein
VNRFIQHPIADTRLSSVVFISQLTVDSSFSPRKQEIRTFLLLEYIIGPSRKKLSKIGMAPELEIRRRIGQSEGIAPRPMPILDIYRRLRAATRRYLEDRLTIHPNSRATND